MLCIAAACSGPQPRSMAGRTRETAIELQLVRGTEPDALVADRDGPGIALPHWYRLSLSTPSRVMASAGEGFFVEVVGADRDKPIDGDVLIRVDGHTPPYRLHVVATAVQPVVELPPDAGPPPCDRNDVDPTNPRCAGVIPCDPNAPDFKNVACCGCTICAGPIATIPGANYGWLSLGSRQGITKGYRGRVAILSGGKYREFPASIIEVERDRSKIMIIGDPDFPVDDPAHAGEADLRPPHECDWAYDRVRDR